MVEEAGTRSLPRLHTVSVNGHVSCNLKDEDIKLCPTFSVLLSFVTNQRKAIGRRKHA